jgi:TrmH family RNA methyltransferase
LGRRSARVEEAAFVVEGPTLLREAMSAGWTVEDEYGPAGWSPISLAPVATLADGVLERVATTQHPQPPLAVVRDEREPLDLARAGLVLVLDRVGDPGNLGTILRSAEAAGVDGVVLTPGCVDVGNPKVLRASAGAVFHVPTIECPADVVAAAGLRLVGTTSHDLVDRPGVVDLHQLDWAPRTAIVLGSEAHGVDPALPIDEWVTIRHRGRAESLNVAMAATLLAFAAADARDQPRGRATAVRRTLPDPGATT